MQQEMAILKSKIETNGPSNTQSQNVLSYSPTIQLGTPTVIPNPLASTVATSTTTIRARSGLDFYTKDRFHELLKQEAERASKVVVFVQFQPPYPSQVLSSPFPKDYVNPKFKKFNSKKGNGRNHVIGFMDDLKEYASDRKLRLRELSKSLTDKTYEWFVSLSTNNIRI